MAAAAGNVMYSQVFKKKLADVFRVGTGGGLCFCGINMYFKNDKFYDDWVMPLFTRMEPENAYAVAQQAAKYNLVSKAKLQESRLLVSKQPRAAAKGQDKHGSEDDDGCKDLDASGDFRGSCEDLISREYRPPGELGGDGESRCVSRLYDSDFEPDDSCPGLYIDDTDGYTTELLAEDLDALCATSRDSCSGCRDDVMAEGPARSYLHDLSHYRNDLRACESPRSERSCVTPDSPSLSMQVNIASPLRSSKMSLATVVDGANPAYDRDHVMLDEECTCQVEECIVTCRHDDGTRTDVVHITEVAPSECRCRSVTASPQHHTTPAAF